MPSFRPYFGLSWSPRRRARPVLGITWRPSRKHAAAGAGLILFLILIAALWAMM
jgi:hypothetical protein